MQIIAGFFLLAISSLSFAETSLPSYVSRFRRQIAYGGGIGMTARLDPYNLRNPVQFATGVNFADAITGFGVNQVNTISNSNAYGGGRSDGNAFGSVNGGFPTAVGHTNTWVPGGNGQVYTNNVGFSGTSGRGFGSGSAMGFGGK